MVSRADIKLSSILRDRTEFERGKPVCSVPTILTDCFMSYFILTFLLLLLMKRGCTSMHVIVSEISNGVVGRMCY